MSELTPAAIEEALNFAGLIGLEGPWLSLHVNALATTIAYVHTRATNDALERAAVLLDNANTAMFDMYAGEIREMKVPT